MNHSIHLKVLLAAGAAALVLAAVGVPVLDYLPILGFFALCSLLMMFMMGGTGHGGGANPDGDNPDGDIADRTPSAHRL